MGKKGKMWLEDYVNFSENRNEHNLTCNHLNQIISMHGFTKLYRASKNALVDAVNAIDLLVPFRSTLELKEEVSSSAFLTVEEVMEDLSTLQWQECSVRAIETLTPGKESFTHDDLSTKCDSSNVGGTVAKMNPKRKRKAKLLAEQSQA